MLLISVSTFICIAFGVMAIYWLMFRPASATATRLRELDDQGGTASVILEESPVVKFAERVAEPINRLVPPSAADAKKLQKQLMQAGYRSPHAPAIYRMLQLFSMFIFPALIVLLWLYLTRPLNGALVP